MAKLPRVTAKVFASNAPQDKIGQFGSAKAGAKVNTSDISTIQGLPAFAVGWTEAVVQGQNYPTIEEMNGLQKVFSQQIAYLFEQGIPEYDSNTTYYVGSVCKVTTANSLTFYVSKVDNNIGNLVTNTRFWIAFPMYSKTEIINSVMPDYSKGVSISNNVTFTAPNNGFVIFSQSCDNGTGTMNIAGQSFNTIREDGSSSINQATCVPISKGQTIRITYVQRAVFYPCKGV